MTPSRSPKFRAVNAEADRLARRRCRKIPIELDLLCNMIELHNLQDGSRCRCLRFRQLAHATERYTGRRTKQARSGRTLHAIVMIELAEYTGEADHDRGTERLRTALVPRASARYTGPKRTTCMDCGEPVVAGPRCGHCAQLRRWHPA